MGSSNKQKDDQILSQIDGLFAKEYKKPQQAIIDSLNNSKKNSPENSSSKPQKNDTTLNETLLNKKLEDLAAN